MTTHDTDIAKAVDSGLISAEGLAQLIEIYPHGIKLVDATYPADPSLPGIHNSVTFDIDDIADPESPMAHMLPTADYFAAKVGALGITNSDFVVVYDRTGFIMAASRAWWMFRAFGHNRVAVLDSGLENWVKKGFPLTQKSVSTKSETFTADFKPELVLTYDQVKQISHDQSRIILDARPAERFAPQHIPGSKNIPALGLFAADRTMKTTDEFQADLATNQIALDSPLSTSCGSGVTACAVALALYRSGKKDVPVYDGSWTEWSSRQE